MVLENGRGGYRQLGVGGGNFLSGPRLVKILIVIGSFLLVIFVASSFHSDEGEVLDTFERILMLY